MQRLTEQFDIGTTWLDPSTRMRGRAYQIFWVLIYELEHGMTGLFNPLATEFLFNLYVFGLFEA